MSAIRNPGQIRIGLITDEPIRLAGLLSIIDQPAAKGHGQLVPVTGSMEFLLSEANVDYLVVDLISSSISLQTLNMIRRARPAVPLIVVGPEGDDNLVLEAIIAGARAYLEPTAGPESVRYAIDVVTGGSIWAPRRLLSKLIDRLLKVSDSSLTNDPHLTDRELQVLDLILKAHSNREIARQLGIEERTVKAHVGRLMRKTGAENRIDLSMRALNPSLSAGLGIGGRRKAESRKDDSTEES
jgi:DNA-binding NarL/FixJ family response regulator